MGKRLFAGAAGLFAVLFLAGAALAAGQSLSLGNFSGGTPPLAGTNWVGTVTFVDTAGTKALASDVTVSFVTHSGNLVSGFSPDPANPGAQIAFSGVIDSFPSATLQMAAPDFLAFGRFVQSRTVRQLIIRGSSTLTGGSFYGVLTKQ